MMDGRPSLLKKKKGFLFHSGEEQGETSVKEERKGKREMERV
jgi:hypothetical protein